MQKSHLYLAVAFTILTSVSHAADDNYIAPRNEWGQPDLRGVWNFSSNTPLERPAAFADQEFLTADQVAQLRARAESATIDPDPDNPDDRLVGYNQFWVEGTPLSDNVRTSL
ncbi:MAG: hypothetical protein WBJ75_01125, partial [Pseudohongiellaceae bacterium]